MLRLKLIRWQGEAVVLGRNQALKMLLRRAQVEAAKTAKAAERRG